LKYGTDNTFLEHIQQSDIADNILSTVFPMMKQIKAFQLFGCLFLPLWQSSANEMVCSCKSDLWNGPKYTCKALLFVFFSLISFKWLNLQHRHHCPSREWCRSMNHQLD